MKYLAYLCGLSGIILGLAIYSGKMAPKKEALPEQAASALSPNLSPIEKPASQNPLNLPEPSSLEGIAEPSTLREEEVLAEITRIDAKLDGENWVDRANRAALRPEEFKIFRGLLQRRNQLFIRKHELAEN